MKSSVSLAQGPESVTATCNESPGTPSHRYSAYNPALLPPSEPASRSRVFTPAMIRLSQLTLIRGTKVLLEAADVVLNPGDKIGLIGANGTGKSSLFALL